MQTGESVATVGPCLYLALTVWGVLNRNSAVPLQANVTHKKVSNPVENFYEGVFEPN